MWIAVCYCVMEYGKIKGIYMIILIGVINEILEFKTIEAYSWSNNQWLQCSKECDPDTFLGDPFEVWDSFPCPPSSEPELFLELDWLGRLGPINGEIIRRKVATRCGINIPQTPGANPDFADTKGFIKDCDINCILVVLAVLVCFVVLSVPVLICCLKRQNVCSWVRKKTFNRQSLTRESPMYRDNLYPPLSNSATRESEIIYNADGAQTRLISPEMSQKTSISPYRYYEEINKDRYPDRYITRPEEDPTHLHKNSSEETSLTYSGNDTAHTYESLKDSQRTASNRLSNTSGFSAENRNSRDKADQELYNSSLASDGQGQRPCSCPRCSRKDLYNPYESVDYNTAYNVYPQRSNNPYNKFQQYRITSPKQHIPGDQRSRYPTNNDNKDTESYIEGPAPPEVNQSDSPYYNSDIYGGSVNSDVPTGRHKCSCRKCSQTQLNYNMPSPTYPNESEFYGVPDRMTINMVPLRPCNCRKCSQSNINQIGYDYRQDQRFIPRQPCACPRCLQALQRPNPMTESYIYDPDAIENIQSEQETNNRKHDRRKKRRSNSDRALSMRASSSDTNTGSEQSYRMGLPKTNGSLYRSKLSKT